MMRYTYRRARSEPKSVNMASPVADVRRSANDFLFAAVGIQQNGMTLTVLSMLAQQDVDPWDEVARLLARPKQEAAARLASRIWAASVVLPDGREVSALASDLVGLLPGLDDGLPTLPSGRRPILPEFPANTERKTKPADLRHEGKLLLPNWARSWHFARLVIFLVGSLVVIAIRIEAPGAIGAPAAEVGPSVPTVQPAAAPSAHVYRMFR